MATIKAITVVIYFEDGDIPSNLTCGSMLNGGKVVGIAAYDMFETMDIAEKALEESYENSCIDAVQKIKEVIGGMYGSNS